MDDEIAEAEGSHEPTEFKKEPGKAVASGWIGSALEYYDFFVYATAASLVFPDVFFPKGNPKVAIVESLATYGVGYAARPIGAFFLGRWGDKHGRKNVLVLCMLTMGCATFLVGLLPTYAAIGVLAPILLVVLRLIQGFAVGGELSGASAMIVENSPFGRRGYYASYTLQGTQGGQLIAAAVFLPLYFTLSTNAMDSWGWRIPFLLSSIVVTVGYLIRRNVDETPAFKEEATYGKVPGNPVYEAFRQSWPNMARVLGISLMNGVATLATTFGGTFATNAAYGVGMNTKLYLFIPVIGNAIAMILIPYIGNLSDRIGRRPCIIAGSLGAGVLGVPVPVLHRPRQRPPDDLFRGADVGMHIPGLQRGVPVAVPGNVPDPHPGELVRDRAEPRRLDHCLPALYLRSDRRPHSVRLRGEQEVRPARHCQRDHLQPPGHPGPHPGALDCRQHHLRVDHPLRDRGLHSQGDVHDPPERLRRGMGEAGV